MINSKQLNAICAVLFGFFVMGFCDIVGISSDYAKEAFRWSDTMAGLVPSMVFVWFLFLGVPVGVLMNRWGRKNTVLISMAVTVVGMLVPLIFKESWACIIGYALLGIGNAILQVSLNPLLSNVVTDPKLMTSSLTAGQVVKAVSSFVGPFIMLFAVNVLGGGDKSNWYLAFPVLGVITLVSGLWLMLSPIKDERKDAGKVQGESNGIGATFALLGNPFILMMFFGIFFVVGIDVATNFVSSKVLIQRFSWEIADAGVAPQIYFISRTIGAFLGVFFMTRIKETTYFRWNIIICIVAILILAFSPVQSATLDLVCIGAIGFLCSCIFPIIYSMALQAEPDKGNLISGLMITAVAGGGAVTPFIGWATETFQTITAGVCILLICAVYLTICSFKKVK
ncbi:MAG: MFS transporter [Bacteroidaceae bacterium]|nr:MFS transporter [Bacteroidaceae bacterium]